MTYKDLYDDVKHLGFAEDIEKDQVFLSAARRSQRQLFTDVRQERSAPLPEGQPVIDLRSYIPELLCFVEVCRTDGCHIDADLCGELLRIPEGVVGGVVRYHRMPTPLSEDDTQIDLPSGCEHLLALLCASYLYLDDEPEHAQYYLSLYRDGMLRRIQSDRRTHTIPYTDILGW